MNEKLARYIDQDFVYRFMQNPDVVRSEEDARRYGVNCVSLAHLAIKDLFERELPEDLLCAELYADREHFEHHDPLDDLQTGDLVWFGVEDADIKPEDFSPQYENGKLINWREFPVKHVAVSIGEQNEDGDDLLLHSTYYEGTNVVWPLTRFAKYRRYEKVYGMSRLKDRRQR